jgi:hypothetical protein
MHSLDVSAAAALPVARLGNLSRLQAWVNHFTSRAQRSSLLWLGVLALVAGLSPLEVQVGAGGAQPVACRREKVGRRGNAEQEAQ